jgi:hypothetical protein
MRPLGLNRQMALFPQDRCTVVRNRSEVWFVSSSSTPSLRLASRYGDLLEEASAAHCCEREANLTAHAGEDASRQSEERFSRGFLIVTSDIKIQDLMRVPLPNDLENLSPEPPTVRSLGLPVGERRRRGSAQSDWNRAAMKWVTLGSVAAVNSRIES